MFLQRGSLQPTCEGCTNGSDEQIDSMHEGGRKCLQRYIGESSRTLRMRAKEHFNKLESFKTDSFMLIYWMEVHGD